MSAETRQALEEAIAAHVADETAGDHFGTWMLACESYDIDAQEGETPFGLFVDYSRNASPMTVYGLADSASNFLSSVPTSYGVGEE